MSRIRPWRHWTLRSRMVVAIAALAGVGLILADVSGLLLLRQNLISRVDQQLHAPRSGLRNRLEFEPRVIAQYFNGAGQPCTPAGQTCLPIDPSALTTTTTLGTFDQLIGHLDQGPYTVDLPDGSQWRAEVRTFGGGYSAVGISLAEANATQRNLLLIDVALTALVLAGIGAAAAALVRVGLRPLTNMETAAAEIAGGDLSRRVEDADPHTESGRLGMALNTMLVRIETAMAERTASEQRLRQFLADAAHELRTPLTSIQGFAELYRRGGVQERADLDEAMGAIEDEVGRMRLLVNDLLLLARLDEERPLQQHPVDLLAVAADAVRDAHLRVPTRFVLLGPLHDDNDTFDPVTIEGDESRLRQVATNLVANALQHTPDDAEVVVRVGRFDRRAAGADPTGPPAATIGADLAVDAPVAVLEVADTGPGLAPADAERVFERLFRAEGSRSRRRGGAGLGLSIVSSIVQAHGGRVELFTKPDAGARFRVLLPASCHTEPDSARTEEPDPARTEEPDPARTEEPDPARTEEPGPALSENEAHSKVALS